MLGPIACASGPAAIREANQNLSPYADSSEPAEASESEEAEPGAVAAGYAALLESMTELSADPVSATDEALDGVEATWEGFGRLSGG